MWKRAITTITTIFASRIAIYLECCNLSRLLVTDRSSTGAELLPHLILVFLGKKASFLNSCSCREKTLQGPQRVSFFPPSRATTPPTARLSAASPASFPFPDGCFKPAGRDCSGQERGGQEAGSSSSPSHLPREATERGKPVGWGRLPSKQLASLLAFPLTGCPWGEEEEP